MGTYCDIPDSRMYVADAPNPRQWYCSTPDTIPNVLDKLE